MTNLRPPDLPRTWRDVAHLVPYLLAVLMNVFIGWAPNDLAEWRLDVMRIGAPVFVLALLWRSKLPTLVAALGVLLGYFGGDLYLAAGMFCIGMYRRGRVATIWAFIAFFMICLPSVPLITMTMDVREVSTFTRDIVRGLGATAFLVALPAMWGAYLDQNAELLQTMRGRALEAEEHQEVLAAQASQDERARIAGEMHDILGHKLMLITMQAGALEMAATSSTPEKVEHLAGQLRETSRAAMQDLRSILAVLGTETAETAPQPHLRDIRQLVEANGRAGAKIELRNETTRDIDTIGTTIGRTAYRVAQEALTNAHKHAPGAQVTVTLQGPKDGMLVLKVHNYRLPHTPPGPGNGSGLTRLSERVRLAGGTFDTIQDPDGWLVTATLPWPGEQEKK